VRGVGAAGSTMIPDAMSRAFIPEVQVLGGAGHSLRPKSNGGPLASCPRPIRLIRRCRHQKRRTSGDKGSRCRS
jgi:hypothetical protein